MSKKTSFGVTDEDRALGILWIINSKRNAATPFPLHPNLSNATLSCLPNWGLFVFAIRRSGKDWMHSN
jgi:hypothetical protein